ncbi:MAG: MATE family efflux transporter [Tissierellia bacterium]|nr:MATE family efflux transporter [Tissierellia bacterium]
MEKKQNKLGQEPVGKLLFHFALPSIVAMIVSALYNIVDQFFIGNSVGMLGNAATNVSFPLTTVCIALALTSGIGGAANFNISMGRGEEEEAKKYIGNTLLLIGVMGVTLIIITNLFLDSFLYFFGATEDILPYAREYVTITSRGFLFLIFVNAGSNLIRADGSPLYSMICIVTGAVINAILDPIFIFIFHMGMRGAAWATVTGQGISALMVLFYLKDFKTIPFKFKDIRWKFSYIGDIIKLGAGAGFNQISLLVVQIVVNNLFRKYGALSIYGPNIPLAAIGIVMKVNMIFFSMNIGMSQGLQPISSYNYGAGNYERVRQAYFLAAKISLLISLVTFLIFQLFPNEIMILFGRGSKEYYEFGVRLFRVFMFFTFINGLLPVNMGFFSSIGMAIKGVFIALSRQIIFLIPLVLILSRIFGIDGILYAGPIADFLAAIVSIFLVSNQLKKLKNLSKRKSFH